MDEFRQAIDDASAGDHQELEVFMVNHLHDDGLAPSLVCWAINIVFALSNGSPSTTVTDFGRRQLGDEMYQRVARSWEKLLSNSAPKEVAVS